MAAKKCTSLTKKHVTPHVLRRTAAMELLQAGTDPFDIALWMGHESVQTTQIYLDASLELKEKVLAKVRPHNSKAGRYRPGSELTAFLASL